MPLELGLREDSLDTLPCLQPTNPCRKLWAFTLVIKVRHHHGHHVEPRNEGQVSVGELVTYQVRGTLFLQMRIDDVRHTLDLITVAFQGRREFLEWT
jgi:hypothetical protein